MPLARLNSLQVQAADLAAAAKFYGQFLGLELGDEPQPQGPVLCQTVSIAQNPCPAPPWPIWSDR